MGELSCRAQIMQAQLHSSLDVCRNSRILVQRSQMEGNTPAHRQKHHTPHRFQCGEYRIHRELRLPADRGIRPVRIHHQKLIARRGR